MTVVTILVRYHVLVFRDELGWLDHADRVALVTTCAHIMGIVAFSALEIEVGVAIKYSFVLQGFAIQVAFLAQLRRCRHRLIVAGDVIVLGVLRIGDAVFHAVADAAIDTGPLFFGDEQIAPSQAWVGFRWKLAGNAIRRWVNRCSVIPVGRRMALGAI